MTQTGIWDENEALHHVTSDELVTKLSILLDPTQRVLDFGCGLGGYIRNLKFMGFSRCYGIEGTNLPEHIGIDIFHRDLTEPLNMEITGQVLSLEVGEHIPKEFEQVFLDNVTSHCDSKLVLSWAIPGQAGIGHVNCQPHDYIIAEVEKRGLWFNPVETAVLRAGRYENAPWFKDTIMVFNR